MTVTNEAGEAITDGSLAIVDEGITVTLSEPIAIKGKFTVTIAANSVYMAEFGEGLPEVLEGSGNDEVKLTYNVDPYVGIAAIDAEEGEIIYLDINGTHVNNPGEGLYIKVKGNKAEKVIRR